MSCVLLIAIWTATNGCEGIVGGAGAGGIVGGAGGIVGGGGRGDGSAEQLAASVQFIKQVPSKRASKRPRPTERLHER
jgi:hypothetical protein